MRTLQWSAIPVAGGAIAVIGQALIGTGLQFLGEIPAVLSWIFVGISGFSIGTAVGLLQVAWFQGALRRRWQWVGANSLGWFVASLAAAVWRASTDQVTADAVESEIVLTLGSGISALLTGLLLHQGVLWSMGWVLTGILAGRSGIWLGLGFGKIIVTALIGDTPVDGILILHYLASFPATLVGIRTDFGIVGAVVAIFGLVLLLGLPHSELIWRAMPTKRRRAPTNEMLQQSIGVWVERRWRLAIPVLGATGALLAVLVFEPRREVEITFINRSAAPIDVEIVPRWTNGETGATGEPLHLEPGETRALPFAVSHSRIEWLWFGPTVFVDELYAANSCRHVTLFAAMRMGWQVDASVRRHCLVFHA